MCLEEGDYDYDEEENYLEEEDSGSQELVASDEDTLEQVEEESVVG